MRIFSLVLLLAACGGGDYGERCQTRDDCSDAQSCVGEAEGDGRCMYQCTSDNGFSCPSGYTCFGDRTTGPKSCLRECNDDADCPADWRCSSELGVSVCLTP